MLLFDEAAHSRTSFVRRVIMLGQSMNRMQGSNSASPCIIPKGCLWERSRQSPIWGWEQLRFQGLEETLCPARARFTNHALVDLAGLL